MNCTEFRAAVGADPALEDAAVLGHAADCPACAAWRARVLTLDAAIGQALAVDVAGHVRAPRAAPAVLPVRRAAGAAARTRRGWLALAASMVLGVAIGAGLWVSYPRDSLAGEAIGHIKHEPQAFAAATPLGPEQVAAVLTSFGVRLRDEAGPVTYSSRCYWQGHWVPHLVLRTASGPVTVFLLPHRAVEREQRFDVEGYSGVVLPAPRGSIAVVGRDVPGLAAIAQQVFSAVDWGLVPAA